MFLYSGRHQIELSGKPQASSELVLDEQERVQHVPLISDRLIIITYDS